MRVFAMAFALVVTVSIMLVRAPLAYADECPAGGDHEYSATILTPATEDADGVRQYTCIKCGYTFTVAIPATGHEWSDWIVEEAPTCTSDGSAYRVCTRYPDDPHYDYKVLPALSPNYQHDYVETSRVDATCTEPGAVTYTCSICGDTYTDSIPALGHAWGEWIVDRQPTTEAVGSEHRVCLNDPTHVEYADIPVLQADTSATEPQQTTSAEPQKPDTADGFLSMTPNALDAVLLATDAGVTLAWLCLVIPLIPPLLWIGRKKKEAADKFNADTSKDDDGGKGRLR